MTKHNNSKSSSMRSGNLVADARYPIRGDESCTGCKYYRGKTCQYLDMTGHMRGCRPGKECTKYETD